MSVLRVTAAWVAGLSHMRWWSSLGWNALGGVVRAALVGLVAYVVGGAAASAIGTYGVVAAGLLATVVVGVLLVRRRRHGPGRER